MDCAMSIIRLSDYHDGQLGRAEERLVREHLIDCRSCRGIYQDLESIVLAAWQLRRNRDLVIPTERVWRRLGLAEKTATERPITSG
ncbi:MAG TPA: zf-HC2 domain-containing protein [Blastocatellia bacterium]|nr:zf-HC2 domain-containing protein [Blastocatellia bacterium]